jgi:hypothetical protein
MANRYGEAALMAVRQRPSAGVNPVARWESAVATLYPTSPAARKKGSPRGAFLGLCEAGLVRDIPAGHYAASAENKSYAVRAVTLLTERKQNWSTSTLWRAVENDPERAHNGQMDIVLALWRNDLIVSKP